MEAARSRDGPFAARRAAGSLRAAGLIAAAFVSGGPAAASASEILGRGVVALPRDDGVYVGWRLLPWDAPDAGFHVYRSEAADGPYDRVSAAPVVDSTGFVDVTPAGGRTYFYRVRAVDSGGVEAAPSEAAAVATGAARTFLEFPLRDRTDIADAMASAAAGDLNADGTVDFVLLMVYGNSGDEDYPVYLETPYRLEAFLSGGGGWASTWRIDTGFAPENGDQVLLVWDLDGDAAAEIAVRTGEGGLLSVLDGGDGRIRATAAWPECTGHPPCNNVANAVVALLEDTTGDGLADPFILTQTGIGTALPVPHFGAFAFGPGDALVMRRDVTVSDEAFDDRHPPIGALGTHGLPAADLDGDGRDEVMPCGSIFYDDWSGYWVVDGNHCDICFPADIAPDPAGPELFVGAGLGTLIQLAPDAPPRTVWQVAASFDHGFHTGWCADVMASHEGMECFAWEYHDDEPTGEHFEIGHLFAADGTDVAGEYGPPIGVNVVPVDWRSGDQQKEIFDGNCGGGDDPGAARCAVWPSRVGDVLGDSREEIVAYRPAFAALRVYANPEARAGRQVTPLADRGYRAGIARWGLGYMTNWVAAKTNQPRSDIVSPAGCGDGACGGGETCLSCPADCGACPPACGDGECAADESCAACPGDCGACPADDVAPDADASLLDTPAEVRDAAAEIPADGEAGGPPGGCTCAASGRSGPAPWAVLGLVLAAALRRRRTGLPARRGTPSRAPLRLPPSSPSSAAARPPRSSWRAMASASMPRKVAARATPRSGTGRPG